jgi:hypothetical protein
MNSKNNYSSEDYDKLIVKPDEDGNYFIEDGLIKFQLTKDKINNIIHKKIYSLKDHPADEFVEDEITFGAVGDYKPTKIDLNFTIEDGFLNIFYFYFHELIARIDIRKQPHNITHAGGYIHLKNIGKRKIRYYKNGNKYVIVKGKKKKIK